jgi:hypothetical protein
MELVSIVFELTKYRELTKRTEDMVIDLTYKGHRTFKNNLFFNSYDLEKWGDETSIIPIKNYITVVPCDKCADIFLVEKRSELGLMLIDEGNIEKDRQGKYIIYPTRPLDDEIKKGLKCEKYSKIRAGKGREYLLETKKWNLVSSNYMKYLVSQELGQKCRSN